jgi:hypothetical protein
MLLIKDSDQKIFGAYCSEAWKNAKLFHGTGDSWVFSFDAEDDIQVYEASGKDE